METLTARWGNETATSFLGLRFACQWATRNASGPFSCYIACILGEGADVRVEIDNVCGTWMRVDNVTRKGISQ